MSSRGPREVPVFIPRPTSVEEGEPPPWAGRRIDDLDMAAVRRRLALHSPVHVEGPMAPDVRRSAVLVPLFGDDEVWVVLGKRSAELPSHRGDISFPGGRHDPDADRDLAETAVREAEEEMGIEPAQVEIVGELDHLGTVTTRFLIAPYVAVFHGDAHALRPTDGEVERVLLVPLRRLLEPGVYHQEIWGGAGPRLAERGPDDPSARWSGGAAPEGPMGPRPVNFFTIDDWDVVWGATATMLRQLLDVATRPD